ncbi:hypothetical protein HK096_003318 [Nowakowskiella sp. JEL0078]|nr:hypothetical protein HK096_003318 [Nowakowskiella sp. JEL0078]
MDPINSIDFSLSSRVARWRGEFLFNNLFLNPGFFDSSISRGRMNYQWYLRIPCNHKNHYFHLLKLFLNIHCGFRLAQQLFHHQFSSGKDVDQNMA